jgi:hypothetical protein
MTVCSPALAVGEPKHRTSPELLAGGPVLPQDHRVSASRARSEVFGGGVPLNGSAEVLPPRGNPQALLRPPDREDFLPPTVLHLGEQLHPNGIGANRTAFPAWIHGGVDPQGKTMIADADDLAVNQLDDALEAQGLETETGKKLVDLGFGNWVKAGGHSETPAKEVASNKPLAGVRLPTFAVPEEPVTFSSVRAEGRLPDTLGASAHN